jgi:hypothetical protein
MQGQRPGSSQPGVKPQVTNQRNIRGLKARLIGCATDESGFQPSTFILHFYLGLRPRLG